MPEEFEWVGDVGRGEWLRGMEAEPFGSILSIVPSGFEAYARVFHPVECDRPRDTKTWQGVDAAKFFDGVEDIEATLEREHATWAQTAASFRTAMHAEAQYARLVRRDYRDVDGAIGVDGWRYQGPFEGRLDSASLTAASTVLARHTTTPDAGIAAIWEGWGGLVSSAGVTPLRFESSGGAFARYTDDGAVHIADRRLRRLFLTAAQQRIARARSVIARSVIARSVIAALPGRARSEPEPGSGVLTREAAAGPRFDLHGGTGRHYVLFEAGAITFADAAWPGRAPWVDDLRRAQSPSILWPDDQSWVLATEIDFDSTLVAGTASLVRELLRTPGLEVFPIRTVMDLTWDGDELNRPA